MKKILDPAFRYSPSFDTDIRKRFARIKREKAEQAKREAANAREAAEKLAGAITPKRRRA